MKAMKPPSASQLNHTLVQRSKRIHNELEQLKLVVNNFSDANTTDMKQISENFDKLEQYISELMHKDGELESAQKQIKLQMQASLDNVNVLRSHLCKLFALTGRRNACSAITLPFTDLTQSV